MTIMRRTESGGTSIIPAFNRWRQKKQELAFISHQWWRKKQDEKKRNGTNSEPKITIGKVL
jgi:hypothetical protein